MPRLNLLVVLNTYSDNQSSNNPSLSNFKWNRGINGIPANNPLSMSATIPAGETVTLFSGEATKKFVYLETDKEVTVQVNDGEGAEYAQVKPFVINNSTQPGILARTSDINSLTVTNNGEEDATIFLAAVE